MSHDTKLRRFARNIIDHEGRVNPPPAEIGPTSLPVIDKLRPILATFMGRAGYHALISRAVVLTRDEVPWLGDVGITADGSLENFAGLAAKQESADSEILLAHLIGLLVAFIGEVLTLRLVRELWQDFPIDNNFSLGNEHE